MLKELGKGLLGRLLAYAVFGLGFWLLFRGFLEPSVLQGIVGAVLIPVGMYLMVTARRRGFLPDDREILDNKEAGTSDPLDGSRQSH